MTDNTIHYPREVALFALNAVVWKTSITMCRKRKTMNMFTITPSKVTCDACRIEAIAYYAAKQEEAEMLLDIEESGALKGTSVERMADALLPALREVVAQAKTNIRIFQMGSE